MMISELFTHAQEAFVWIWLPEQTQPVVAGRIIASNKNPSRFVFTYGRSYLARDNAIALSPFELPLEVGVHEPQGMNLLHSCLRDAGPDAWGRRIVENHYVVLGLNELDYLLLSGSNRIGALDFQLSANEYISREMIPVSLDELLEAAGLLEQYCLLPPELDRALLHGTSVGGARPKALIQANEKYYIAKFSSSTDTYEIIKAEYVAMRLAALAGLKVAEVSLVSALGKSVLLVERFDRQIKKEGVTRSLMLSGLSLLGLNEMEARYASYVDLAHIIRQQFSQPKASLHEFFSRLVFNILIGNTDDHARNHSAFWDGQQLSLTPAYDLCPQPRTGGEASQAMQIKGIQGNLSRLKNALSISEHFHLSETEAKQKIEELIAVIEKYWPSVCDEAELALSERNRLWQRAVFNPFCFEGWS